MPNISIFYLSFFVLSNNIFHPKVGYIQELINGSFIEPKYSYIDNENNLLILAYLVIRLSASINTVLMEVMMIYSIKI